MNEKICEQCGKSYPVRKYLLDKARFCSRKCCSDWRTGKKTGSNKITIICNGCGKSFEVYPFRADTAKFCSKTCMKGSKRPWLAGENNPTWKPKLQKVCKFCGKSFEVIPYEEYRLFCSLHCYGQWLAINRVGPTHHQWVARKTRNCKHCGQLFEYSNWESDKVFCSILCKTAHLTGPEAPNWRGGISFDPYSYTWNHAFREHIRTRDKYICAICRLPGKTVHHINYNKLETTGENCITLCKKCHGKTNYHRAYWEGTLGKIMVARENPHPFWTAGGEYVAIAELRYA